MALYMANVCKRHKKSPDTFYVPSKQVIELLKIGDLVKLSF